MAETINHPAYYKRGGIEAIDVIEAWNLDFCPGNVIKYVSRAGYKDKGSREQYLRKALWYLSREIRGGKDEV